MFYYSTLYDDLGRINLVKEGFSWVGRTSEKYSTSEDIYGICCDYFNINRMTEEHIYCFCFDSALHITGIFLISIGTVNQSLITPREVMIKALLAGATSIALVHNHPSGDPSPSEYDRLITERVAKAGKIIGIDLIEHLIIGKNSYYSLNEMEPNLLEVKL